MEEKLEMVQIWLHDQDLLDNPNGKELSLEQALCKFLELSKCQLGDTIGKAPWHAFLCHLLLCGGKLTAIQMNIRWVWGPKYCHHLDLTNKLPIQAKLPHLYPKEEA